MVAEFITEPPQIDPNLAWKMFVDRVRNSLGARASVILQSLDGAIFEHYLTLSFPATNCWPNRQPKRGGELGFSKLICDL